MTSFGTNDCVLFNHAMFNITSAAMDFIIILLLLYYSFFSLFTNDINICCLHNLFHIHILLSIMITFIFLYIMFKNLAYFQLKIIVLCIALCIFKSQYTYMLECMNIYSNINVYLVQSTVPRPKVSYETHGLHGASLIDMFTQNMVLTQSQYTGGELL